MPVIGVGTRPALVYNKAWGPGCIANTDEVNPVFVSIDAVPNSDSDQIPPLGALAVDGSQDYYAATLANFIVQLQSMPGTTSWTPSPAQVAIQIAALGLATSANQGTQIGQAGTANGYLGGTAPGALVSAAGLSVAGDMLHANQGVTTEIANLLQSGTAGGTPQPGIPPYIANMKEAAAAQLFPAVSPYTLYTAPAGGARLWYAALCFAYSASSGFTGSSAPLSSLYYDTIAHVFLTVNVAMNVAGQNGAACQNISLGGYPLASGHSIFVGINSGTALPNAILSAAASVLVSTP